jgi:hypothetical protein
MKRIFKLTFAAASAAACCAAVSSFTRPAVDHKEEFVFEDVPVE